MKPFSEISIPGAQKTLQEHRRIYTVVSRTVPAPLLADIQFCRIEDGVLRVTVGTAAVLARLRFSAGQIVDDLTAEGMTVTQVKWHVSREKVETTERAVLPPAKKGHDKVSAGIIQSTANGMPDDLLSRALRKLAKQLK